MNPTLQRGGLALAWLALAVGGLAAAAALLSGPSYRMAWLSLGSACSAGRWR